MTTDTDTPVVPPYKALDLLKRFPPVLRTSPHHEPLWRPEPAPGARAVLCPSWSWENTTRARLADDLVTLDLNAAYLSAASGARVAYGQLRRTGADIDLGATLPPGIYTIRAHPWQGHGIPSPLGTAHLSTDRVRVAHPTVQLLLQLADQGVWPEVIVEDSWTCPEAVRLTKWTNKIKADRVRLLTELDWAIDHAATTDPATAHDEITMARARYQALKDGYSIAIQLMLGPAPGQPRKSSILRPDWYAAIRAQHAFMLWQKAWRCVQAGHGPVKIQSPDALIFDGPDFAALTMLDPCPIRVDSTGRALGAFKIK